MCAPCVASVGVVFASSTLYVAIFVVGCAVVLVYFLNGIAQGSGLAEGDATYRSTVGDGVGGPEDLGQGNRDSDYELPPPPPPPTVSYAHRPCPKPWHMVLCTS